MKNPFRPCSALLLLIIPLQLCAQSFRLFSLDLDLAGQDAFAGKKGLSSFGVGGQVFAEWRFAPILSLGTGFSYMDYSSQGGWNTASWDLGGRIFPFGPQTSGEFYLEARGGMNLMTATLAKTWPGSGHGALGMGYRIKGMGPDLALDLGAIYDLNTPKSQPLQALGARVGLVWYLGDQVEEVSTQETNLTYRSTAVQDSAPGPIPPVFKKPKTSHAKLRTPNTPLHVGVHPANAPQTYTWAKGDNLASIAVAYYGDEKLYPLLVDANQQTIGSPENLKPGVDLLIPQGVSEADKVSASLKADSPEYAPWKTWGTTKSSLF